MVCGQFVLVQLIEISETGKKIEYIVKAATAQDLAHVVYLKVQLLRFVAFGIADVLGGNVYARHVKS